MEVNCPQRTESIVPLQALALMNGPFAERTAAAVGERVLAAAGENVDRQCDVAFRLLFARLPTATERVAITRLLATCAAEASADAKPEEGKPEQTEAQRKQAAAQRAWSQTALVLLNSNEFLHVD
jgi:hypothetical protein